MANEVAKSEPNKAMTLKETIKSEAFKGATSAFFSKPENQERFLQAAVNAQVRVPKLASCDKKSFLMSLMQLAQMGLYPDGRNAHLIPYGNTCTLIIDYKGMVTLALRSDKVSKVEAFSVYKNDHFRLINGEVIHEVDNPFEDRGELIGFYAVCQFKDGTKKYEVMSKKEVDDIRKRSRAGQSGPWVTDYEEMAKKTVFKRLSKWLPVTPDLEAAVEHDNQEYQSNSNQFDRSSRVTANELLGGDDGHEVVDADVVNES